MQKVLFVATVDQHILAFHIPYIEWFKNNGYEVHVASNGNESLPHVDKKHNILFERSPFRTNNIKAYKELKELIKTNNYRLVHCHTPIGGALTRLASLSARKNGLKVIYTAHGFHFYKGAPFMNWLVYYPIEKSLSRYTDVLITINQEDYDAAVKGKFKSKQIVLVNGVGINLEKFQPQTEVKKLALREQYGYASDDFILIYAGELSYRKHQDLLIDVAGKLKDKIPNLKILLAGSGDFKGQYNNQIKKLGVQNQVELLGFRKDIDNLMNLADVAVSASRQEGLPVNVMEAMATGLPLVVTDCRGNRDLVINNENGYVVGIQDVDLFADSIELLYRSEESRDKFSKQNLIDIGNYGIDKILDEMKNIYLDLQ